MDISAKEHIRLKNAISIEGIIALIIIVLFFVYLSINMDGPINMFKTLINTAYELLTKTVFQLMGIAVLIGGFSALISEFGIVSILNKFLSRIIKPLYNLPGAATIGILTTYLSDNPAILSLSKDKGFRSYFKRYQLPALTNLGTSFGMGLFVTTYMISQGGGFVRAAIIGNIGAIIGSIVSVRIMLHFTKKFYGEEQGLYTVDDTGYDIINKREVRQGTILERVIESILEGGKSGVELGLGIIPGVLVICTLVLMLTNGDTSLTDPIPGYQGVAYEGTGLLPTLAGHIDFILQPLFGFKSPNAIAYPITAIGSVGAAMALVPGLLKDGLIASNDIAVFTAIGMCWSGYLSTHVAMMDGLNARQLTGKAIISHTIGGLAAGISAHFIFVLVEYLTTYFS